MLKLKPIPKFKSEDEERDFWATHSSVDYIDWSKAIINPVFPNLKPNTEAISLCLPERSLKQNRQEGYQRNSPNLKEQDDA